MIDDVFLSLRNEGLVLDINSIRSADLNEPKLEHELYQDFVEKQDQNDELLHESVARYLESYERKCLLYMYGLQSEEAFKSIYIIDMIKRTLMTIHLENLGIGEYNYSPTYLLIQKFSIDLEEDVDIFTEANLTRCASNIFADYVAQNTGISSEKTRIECWRLCKLNRQIQAYIKKDFSGPVDDHFFDGYGK